MAAAANTMTSGPAWAIQLAVRHQCRILGYQKRGPKRTLLKQAELQATPSTAKCTHAQPLQNCCHRGWAARGCWVLDPQFSALSGLRQHRATAGLWYVALSLRGTQSGPGFRARGLMLVACAASWRVSLLA